MEAKLRRYLDHHREEIGLSGRTEDWQIEKLAQGEYNINYLLRTDEGRLVLRLNTGSQMDLENQIEYEYRTLKGLEACGRTPKAIYLDDTKKELSYGFLIMDFLKGRSLDYKRDLGLAASCLADIHSFPSHLPHLLRPSGPKREMMEECKRLLTRYQNSKSYDSKKGEKIRLMLEKVGEESLEDEVGFKTCINTELNSGNFIIDGDYCYLVDWEKPLIGDVAQDLGHFLAPTTTLWKTDIILKPSEVYDFLGDYVEKVGSRFETGNLKERVGSYLKLNCMRGLCWCAMAYSEYREERAIKNPDTEKKLEFYMDDDFLDLIDRDYI